MPKLLIALLIAVPVLALLRTWDRGSYRGALGVVAGCAVGYGASQGWLPAWGHAAGAGIVVVSLAGVVAGWWDTKGGGR